MNFFKFKTKHKFWYLFSKIMVILTMVIMAATVMITSNIELPTNISKMSASLGFITVLFVFGLAFLNRINTIFKIKSVGFVVLWVLFSTVELIIAPLTSALSLILIPMLVDDIIITPIFLQIWYNQYDGVVKIDG